MTPLAQPFPAVHPWAFALICFAIGAVAVSALFVLVALVACHRERRREAATPVAETVPGAPPDLSPLDALARYGFVREDLPPIAGVDAPTEVDPEPGEEDGAQPDEEPPTPPEVDELGPRDRAAEQAVEAVLHVGLGEPPAWNGLTAPWLKVPAGSTP